MAMRAEDAPRSLVDDTANTSKRSVLLATGFGAPGLYLRPLRDKLRNLGHDAHTAHPPLYVNTGIGVEKEIRKKAEKLREDQDKPLTGVGYSLGGDQLLHMAYQDPELMDFVFTLGSPCRFVGKKPDEVTVVSFVGRNGGHDGVVPGFLASSPDHDETYKVPANHFTLPYSKTVFKVITHKLENPSSQPLRLIKGH